MKDSYMYEKKTKIKEKRKRKKKKLKYIMIFVLLVTAMVLLGMSSIFNISRIHVSGVKYCTDEDVITASGIIKGTNGFKSIGGNLRNFLFLRYGQAEANILNKCPYIKNVTVKYILPDKVLIHVEEREPFVLIPYIGAFLLIDREGYVLKTVDYKEKFSLPLAKGVKFTNYEIGQALKIENKENFDKLIILIDTLTEEEKNDNFKLMDYIDTIDVSDINNIYLFVDSRLVVNYGDLYDLNYRIRAFKQIFYKNINKKEKGMLDFTVGDYPVFIPED
ncbi:MAG: FtsQ-type POTRA domain-containing protein [Firmicutes bacterium]|nr:FtsQ-type POTRA domain-containing protein [Bacillota bacterium]